MFILKNKNFIKYSIFLLIFLISSCYSDDNLDVIPRQEFIAILTELHIADAVLNEKKLYDRKLRDSTKSYYNYILIKHNMSRKKFDDNLMYYAQNMEDFTLMYDEVIENLKNQVVDFKRRKSIFNLPLIVIDSINLATAHLKKGSKRKNTQPEKNLWTKKTDWYLPKDGTLNTIEFEKAIYSQSKFELTADILIFTDDQSVNPTMQMDILYKDNTHDFAKDTTLVKDGKWHTYKLTIKTDSLKKPKKLTCKIVNHSRKSIQKHLEVNNISLIRHIVRKFNEMPNELIFKKKRIKPAMIK